MVKRIEKLRSYLQEKQLDAILITKGCNRRYFSGFKGSTAYLIITVDKQYIVVDFRYLLQASIESPLYEVLEMSDSHTIMDIIKKLGLQNIGIEEKDISLEFANDLKVQGQVVHLDYISSVISKIRMIKDEEEIRDIKEACHITDLAFEHILTSITKGVSEKEVNLELQHFMKKFKGVETTAELFIVASGKRSALPHGIATDKLIEEGDAITLDFGCNYNGYWSDVTRTVYLKYVSEKQRAIYNCVREAQLKAIEAIKPGRTGREIDLIARTHIQLAGYGEYFGHGLGHSFGLEIHESPRLAQNTEGDIVLEEGMILTVEPGIYIEGFGGVRIEDDVLVTQDGYQVLTHCNKSLIVL